MAKKDKKDKKSKDKSSKLENAAVEAVLEAPVELIADETPVASVEELADAPKARAKRVAKKVEIPASKLTFVGDFPLDDILPREQNTRFRGKETEKVLSEMIQRFGWTQPLTLDAEHRIVDGQYRYELAKKWKLTTVPVVITDGVSADAGTTDLFHMLAGRIAEWDKWNYPATDAVLKSLDGGLITEKVLGFEAISEAGELRALARELGWFIEIIPKALSGSTVTLETLAGLLKKSLAGKYQYDPAQLLYIEALREQLEQVRQEMVDNGETAGGVKPKLEQHIGEENRKQAEGEAIAEENGYEFEISEDGKAAVFTADREIAYVVNKVAIAEEAAKVQVKSAQDMSHRFREMADGKKMGLTQFKILASYFSDMTPEEAADFFNGTAATKFNEFVDSVLAENRTISPDRSAGFPLTEAELKAEQYRLRGEDIRKDTEKAKDGGPKGLEAMLVNELKGLLKTEGLPLSGKKSELVERLTEAGYGADGIKVASEVPELPIEVEDEELAEEAPELEPIAEESDDASMVFAADEPEVVDAVAEVKAEAEASAPEENESDAEVEAPAQDLKALKKRGKELKEKAEESELSKSELKEFKAIRKQLKAAKD